MGVACKPLNCSPSMLPSYSWNVPPSLCHSTSQWPRSSAGDLWAFFFSDVLTSEFVSDAGWRLTVVGLLVLVRALRLQRAAVVVAVHLLVLVGEFSICRRDATQVTLPVETASCSTLSLDFNMCLPNPAERRVCLVCARFIFFC